MLTLRKILLIALWGVLPLNHLSADQSRQIVRILGCSQQEKIPELRERVYFCLDYFDIREDVVILLSFVDFSPQNNNYKKDLWGATIPTTFEGKPMMHVLIEKNIRFDKQISVIYHEMTHVKQFIKKELIEHHEDHITWKGHDYYRVLETEHNQRAWEREAMLFENKIELAYNRYVKDKESGIVRNNTYQY